MFTLKIENANGEIFELTHDSRNYAVIGVEGLTYPPTAVNTSTGGGLDGTFHNSSRVDQRNIVITIILNGDIEANRQRLYKIFNLKKPCKIYFQNENRSVFITGYVETLEGDLFVKREQMQISIICPRPFWEDLNTIYTELSNTLKLFEFPFSIAFNNPIPFSDHIDYPLAVIDNIGDIEAGVIMNVSITDTVTGLKLYNLTTQKYIGFDYSFADGDELTIDTISGEMSAMLNRNGDMINLLNYMADGSTWLKLLPGENEFSYAATAGADSVSCTFALSALYGGV